MKALRQATDVVIRLADKGGGVVIQDYEEYHGEALNILSDKEYYATIKNDPTKEIQEKLSTLLASATKDGILTKKEKYFIQIPIPSTPFFYHLPKLHKSTTNPPGRPIISGINGPTCNLSHFIDLYLKDYVKILPSHLKDSDDLIRHLKQVQMQDNLCLLTLDVTALYSNIDHNLGINCVEHYLESDPEITEKQKVFITTGLRLILENNFFKYDGKIYHQTKGTAMGTRVAPSHANLFMGLFEKQYIDSEHPYLKEHHPIQKIHRRFVLCLARQRG